MSLLSSARVADHPPELCPSQSSCRNLKRSQVNSSSCSTFSPVGRAEDECDHTQVPPLSPPPPTLAYPAISFLRPEQNQVPATTLLSEAPRIMRLADRCTFSLSEKNRSVLKLRFLSVKSSSMGWQHFTKPQRLEVPSPLPCFVMSNELYIFYKW